MGFEVGQSVKIVGPGVHCSDRHKGLIGVVWFMDKRHAEYGILVDFSDTIGKQSGCWYFPTSLQLAPETDEPRIDLSGYEINELYAAVMAIDKILEGRVALIRMGLATDDDIDVGGIFEALQRELPMREAMFNAVRGGGE